METVSLMECAVQMARLYAVASVASVVTWPWFRLSGLRWYPSWIVARAVGPTTFALAYFHLLRWGAISPGGGAFWTLLLSIGAISAGIGRKLARLHRRELAAILRFEIGAVCGFVVLAAIMGAHYGTTALGERPLDLGLVGSLWCSSRVPVDDFWFAGERLHVYFHGGWTFATLGRAAGSAAFHSYFFGLAYVWMQSFAAALLAARLFGARREGTSLTAAAVLFLGNAGVLYRWYTGVAPFSEAAQLLGARVIPFTINENPASAFWVSELHAHVMVGPPLIAWAALAPRMLRSGSLRVATVVGVLSAIIAMTDSWMVGPAAACGVALLAASRSAWRSAAASIAMATVVALASSSAWLLGLEGFPLEVQGVSESSTRMEHLVLLFGPLWILLGLARASGPAGASRKRTAASLLLVGLFLILVCEVVYLENWHPVPYVRQNTVFRFHYAAWIFMALAVGALWARAASSRAVGVAAWGWITVFAALNSLPSLTTLGTFHCDLRRSLDAADEGRFAAARWLSEHTSCDTVIVESIGPVHIGEVSRLARYAVATVSAMSGRTTLLGEPEKVFQHGISHDRIRERRAALRAIYCDDSRGDAVLRRFGVTYVVLGPVERRSYPECDTGALRRNYPVAFDGGATVVLEVPRGPGR